MADPFADIPLKRTDNGSDPFASIPKKARTESLAPEDQIAQLTRRGARETGFVPVPGAKPAEPVGLGTQVLQSLYGIPALAGGAKAAQLATRGLPKVAPYTQKFAELMLPRTGKELARTAGAVSTGTAAAYGAGELLPPGASPVVRELTQFGAGALGELPFAAGRQISKAFRPLTQGGVERAGERVTRAFKPEQIEGLPEFEASRSQLVRQMRERLRGQPLDIEQLSAQEIGDLLSTQAGIRTRSAEDLAKSMASRAEQRGGRIGATRNESQIGDDIRAPIESRLQNLAAVRRQNAEKLQKEAFGEAFQKEASGQTIVQTQAAINAQEQINALLRNPVTGLVGVPAGETANTLKKVKNLLGGREEIEGTIVARLPSFEAIEIERRLLRDRAAGLPVEGYLAINQQQAGQLADLIEAIQKEFSPRFGPFLNQYRKDSEPINQFKKALGRSIIGKEEFDITEFKTDPAKLADQVFSTRNSVQNFLTLTGNNVGLANDLARDYLASRLDKIGATTGPQILKELKKNEWLNLPEFARVKRDFLEQARVTGFAEQKGKEVTTAAAEAARPLTLGPDAAAGFRSLLTGPTRVPDIQAQARVLAQSPEGTTAFKQAVRDVMAATAPGGLRATYMQKIKPALQGSGLYRPEDIATLDREVIGIDEVNQSVNRAIQKAATMPGTESPDKLLTRLVQNEVNQMRAGGVFASVIAGLLTTGITGLGLTTGGVGGAVAGATGAALLPRYREYNANIRKAVSDIVSDPVRLQQVLSAPRDQQPGLIARMIRSGLYSAATATNAPTEE